jgi:putative hydrolase
VPAGGSVPRAALFPLEGGSPGAYNPPMRIQADLHVHTFASGHAFSTVIEVAREASRRGLRAVGISDHGPALSGTPSLTYFGALRFLPRRLEGVRLLRGVEANLVGSRGELDLPPELLTRLDYAIVGFHEGCGLKVGSPAKNTRALVGAMRQPNVRVIAHPGNPAFPIELPALVEAAVAHGVALEINNASFTLTRRGSFDTCSRLASLVAQAGGPISLGSDAHVATQVGDVTEAWEVAARAGVRPEQVVNRTYEGLAKFLRLEEP